MKFSIEKNFAFCEVRKVSETWQHPKTHDGKYKPLGSQEVLRTAEKAYEDFLQSEIKKGVYLNYDLASFSLIYLRPCRDLFMPEFENPTCFQAYETFTMGTPMSPVFRQIFDLLNYLTEKCVFPSKTRGYEHDWLRALNLHDLD